MTQDRKPSDEKDVALPSGASGGGESGGGAYPNPHTGKKPEGGGFMGHGGQTEMSYHGHGQLGEEQVGKGNANAPTGETGSGDDEDGSSKD